MRWLRALAGEAYRAATPEGILDMMTNVRRVTWLLAHAFGSTTWYTSCSNPAYSVPSSLQDDDDLAPRGSSSNDAASSNGQGNDAKTGLLAAAASNGGTSADPTSSDATSSGGIGSASRSSNRNSLGDSATSPLVSTGAFPATLTLVGGGVAYQAGGAPTALGTTGAASSNSRAEMTSGGVPANSAAATETTGDTDELSAGGTSSSSSSKIGVAGSVSECTGPTCVIACSSGYADCDDDLSNGCETEIGGNLEHCGACGRTCDSQCVDGVCAVTPCTDLCESPKVFTIGSGTIYGLAQKVCHESYEANRAFNTGQCGLFTPGHPLYINGIEVACDTGDAWNWSTLTKPTPRHGGYCFHDDQLGMNGTSAWFTTW